MGIDKELQSDLHIAAHKLGRFVDFAIEYFEDEENKKEYEQWHLQQYGCLPDEYEKDCGSYEQT